MPLTASHCLSLPLTASRCLSLPPTASECLSLPLDAGQCLSLSIADHLSYTGTASLTLDCHPSGTLHGYNLSDLDSHAHTESNAHLDGSLLGLALSCQLPFYRARVDVDPNRVVHGSHVLDADAIVFPCIVPRQSAVVDTLGIRKCIHRHASFSCEEIFPICGHLDIPSHTRSHRLHHLLDDTSIYDSTAPLDQRSVHLPRHFSILAPCMSLSQPPRVCSKGLATNNGVVHAHGTRPKRGADGCTKRGAFEWKMALEAIRYRDGKLALLDQRLLPHEMVYVDVRGAEDAKEAIANMAVRGAPAIAIAAALAMAVELEEVQHENVEATVQHVKEMASKLVEARPTAVNLSHACDAMVKAAEESAGKEGADPSSVRERVSALAKEMLAEDVQCNRESGKVGAKAIAKSARVPEALNVLTHCNTGSLATAGYGTALGVIRRLYEEGKLRNAVCTETRPYGQGARLTAFELVHDGLPATLIADSAAAALMSLGKVHAVVVGADRIAENGDTANKIGTLSLAVMAKHYGIPFFVAAPVSSIDTTMASGKEIEIEERSPEELTHFKGARVVVENINVWNPAFDVTPSDLITGIITEVGLITKPQSSARFGICDFLVAKGLIPDVGPPSLETAHEALDEASLKQYLSSHSSLAAMLGGSPIEWSIREIGDGNINFIFVVKGPAGGLVVKQGLPYVRSIGNSWPLSCDRLRYEAHCLRRHRECYPDHVPEVYLLDEALGLIVMQYIAPPHIVLRKGITTGRIFPKLAKQMGKYLANVAFKTSLIGNQTTVHREQVLFYNRNIPMCKITEDLVFTEPYMEADHNWWTSPQLDEEALFMRTDPKLKLAISSLKRKFCEQTQALIHGDLHTGSLMVTRESAWVIDAEFAMYGPIGFDVGAFLGNLLLGYFAQEGHRSLDDDRSSVKHWLLSCVSDTWAFFEEEFRRLWDTEGANGDAYSPKLFESDALKASAQGLFLQEILQDALGFAGAKMARRIVGLAHVEDFKSIADAEARAACERRALHCAWQLLKKHRKVTNMEEVLTLAKSC